jgi:CheY-like chemotaxis protein
MSGEGKSERPISAIAVDNDAAIRGFLPRVFSLFGYSGVVAESGEEAIALMGDCTFDIALIDFMMPGMNGLEPSRWIVEHHPNTAIVMMTGYATDVQLEQALEVGVFRCVRKPLPDLGDLRELLEAAINSKRLP